MNALAVGSAILLYRLTGKDHFGECGFITTLSIIQLLAIAGLSFRIHEVRQTKSWPSMWRDPAALWGVVALGFLFLAADEQFRIHENLDFWIHDLLNLRETGWSDRIDDLLVGLYGLIGIGVLTAYRRELVDYKNALPYLVIGFLALFVMVALDAITNRNDVLTLLLTPELADAVHDWLHLTEDAFKVFSEVFFIAAFHAILQRCRG